MFAINIALVLGTYVTFGSCFRYFVLGALFQGGALPGWHPPVFEESSIVDSIMSLVSFLGEWGFDYFPY